MQKILNATFWVFVIWFAIMVGGLILELALNR